MSDNTLEGVELDGDVDVFDIGMFDEGAGGFHTKNNPKDPYQRTQVIQRTGAVEIRCSVVDIVHGGMSADSDYWATLMVLQFRFDPQKRARRIAEAVLELEFGSLNPNSVPPEVAAISFDGHFSLMPSEQSETIVTGADGKLGASYGAELSLGAKWEKTVNRQTTDATTISGGKWVGKDNMPPDRIARWTLLENKTLKSGVPASVRVAVLVKRGDEEEFYCMPRLECTADKWTMFGEKFFGGVPEDDPVLLKPSMRPTNRLRRYDTEELGSVDLDQLGDVAFTTMIVDALKTQDKSKD